MSRDIVDISTPSEWLVVAVGVEGEPTDELAGVEDPDVAVGDEELDRPALAGSADADVVQLAVVAQGDLALGVDLVVADAEVGARGGRAGRPGLDPGAVGLQGRAPSQRPGGA